MTDRGQDEIRAGHEAVFGAGGETRVYKAPGRVNLIGEHTDYNGGFVMPAALDFCTWAAGRTRGDRRLLVHSDNFSETVEIDLDDPKPLGGNHWSQYPVGVAIVLEKAGHRLSGHELWIRGEVPIGSGLSSSAAIEVATGYALLDGSGLAVDRVALAKICQKAENEVVGTRCGIMDQFISCCGTTGHALMLDCRSLDYRLLPVPDSVSLVISNTMVRHELSGGEYNERRKDCETAVFLLSERGVKNIRALRDVSLGQLEALKDELPEQVYVRAHHVVSENERVEQAAEALDRGDLAMFGRLMVASHESLRRDYEVSCEELDRLVELALAQPGVIGSRMTGGGFGGCTISLVRNEHVEAFRENVGAAYAKSVGHAGEIYVCKASGGATRVY